MVKDEELGRGLIRIGFTQLLDDPSAGRIPRNIEVQDAATVVADDKKAVVPTKNSVLVETVEFV